MADPCGVDDLDLLELGVPTQRQVPGRRFPGCVHATKTAPGDGEETQRFSGSDSFPLFVGGCLTKMVFPKQGSLFFLRVTEQLRKPFC